MSSLAGLSRRKRNPELTLCPSALFGSCPLTDGRAIFLRPIVVLLPFALQDGYGGSPIGGSTRQLGDGGRQSVGAGQTQGGGGSSGLNPYGDNTNGEEPEI